jgi:hypothetical protein
LAKFSQRGANSSTPFLEQGDLEQFVKICVSLIGGMTAFPRLAYDLIPQQE